MATGKNLTNNQYHFEVTPQTLIRLLLAVREMNAGQFWALLRALGMKRQPEKMGAGEIEKIVKNAKNGTI